MAGRRRSWTLEQKLALVAEMERCDNVAAFARERDVSTALLYTWRRELRYAVEASKISPRHEPMFVPVVGETSPPGSHDGVVEVEVSGAVVRIGQAIRESAQSNTARAGDQITQRNLDIQPTVTIRPGAPVRVLVTRDLILAPWRGSTGGQAWQN